MSVKYIINHATKPTSMYIEEPGKQPVGPILFDHKSFKFIKQITWTVEEGQVVDPNGKRLADHLRPNDLVHHRNKNPLDNRLSNLRATARRRAKTSKKSGLPLGVSKHREKFRAQFKVNGKSYGAVFETVEDASEWYQTERARAVSAIKKGQEYLIEEIIKGNK